MAEIKISELTSGSTLDGTEVVPIVQSGATVKITTQDIADLGGGGGGGGINSLIPLVSGQYTYNQATAGNSTTGNTTADYIYLHPYIPAQTYTCSELVLQVNTGAVNGLGRIGIYDHNNGYPSNLIYESADIDCSTNGNKVLLTNIDFVAGQVYWIASYYNLSTINIRQIPLTGFIPLNTPTVEGSARYVYRLSYAFGTGLPNPIVGVSTYFIYTIPYLSMKKL